MFEFPETWLSRFAVLFPIHIVQRLMLNRRMRKYLLDNTSWLQNCESLLAFGELTEYERKVMIQPDGFWYDWFIDHMTITKTINSIKTFVTYPDEGKIRIPVKGNILFTPMNGYDKFFVVTEVVDASTVPFKFSISPCQLTSDGKKYKTQKIEEHKVVLRKGGWFSANLHYLN